MSIFDKNQNLLSASIENAVGTGDKQEKKEQQNQLIEIMHMYQQVYGLIDNPQYVLRKSVLSCKYGTKYAWFDCLKDHGIRKGKLPVFTKKDCLCENIHDFGSCLCPEKLYKDRVPMTAAHDKNGKAAKKAPGNEFAHICVPLVDKERGWGQVDRKALIEVNAQWYVPMLLDNAVLVCQRGGIIFIREVPEVEEKQEEKETVEIAPWLIGYKGKPDGVGGKIVTYDAKERNALRDINEKIDWYSYEEQSGKNENCAPYLEGQEFKKKWGGVLIDENYRYWITLGPKVFYPDYSDDGKLLADEFAEYIGCRVDVVLQHMENKSEYVYLECVWSGNIKAHTYNNGIVQAGEPYPQSDSAKKEPYKKDYVDGSIVEFTGMEPESNGDMSKYIVDYLIIYPKE